MKLIDADKLNFHCNYNGDCSGDISHCKECDNYILDYRDVQEQPTAYDVDKVVEQVQKECDESYTDFEKYAKEHGLKLDDEYHYLGLQRAIEIIKAGGKNDNNL